MVEMNAGAAEVATRLLGQISEVLHSEKESVAALRAAGVASRTLTALYPFDIEQYRAGICKAAACPEVREKLSRLLWRQPMRDAWVALTLPLALTTLPEQSGVISPPATRYLGVDLDDARLVTQQLVYCLMTLRGVEILAASSARQHEILLQHALGKIQPLTPELVAACKETGSAPEAEVAARPGWRQSTPWKWC